MTASAAPRCHLFTLVSTNVVPSRRVKGKEQRPWLAGSLATLVIACAVALSACVTGPTEMIVDLATDVPADRPMTVTVSVLHGRRSAADAAVDALGPGGHRWVRGGVVADAGVGDSIDANPQGAVDPITLPASFAVVPAPGGPRDGPVELSVVATVGPGPRGEPAMVLTRIARFQFAPGRTQHVPLFLAMACGSPAIGCEPAAGGHCTLSDVCAARGMSCGDHGCVPIDTSTTTSRQDAGRDSAADTGTTPPPAPSCTLTATPSTGGLATNFAIAWASHNASNCSYRLDGPDWIPVATCSGEWILQGPSVGVHTISGLVEGPGGRSECTATWVVVPPPTCTLSFTPASFGIGTPVHSVLRSDGTTSCFYETNGGVPSDPLSPCQLDMTQVLSSPTLPLPAGDYTTRVHLTGPGGTGECSAVLTALPRPTCTLTFTPNPVNRGSSYQAALTSMNAISCVVGGAAVACDYDQTLTATAEGSTTITVDELGDGGDGSCSATLVILPPVPTCVLGVSPSTGTTATDFAATLTSTDATTCSYVFDGQPPVATACAVVVPIPGSTAGVGTHSLLVTAVGGGGSGTCSAGWTVTP
ncbi:MAG: hypothetical protein WCJ30_08525 [Deltaproteobacteria bacterium]